MTPTRLYVLPISNAAAAGAAMVAHKRIPHRLVRLMPGLHPILLRFAGFEGYTVPALELDGRKVQGSRRIARVLDEVRPGRPLFPREPERRARVEEAERWGDQVLQPVPRRLFRHLLLTNENARLWMGTEMLHMPAPRVMAVLFMPVIRQMARKSRADDARVREDIAGLQELLDHDSINDTTPANRTERCSSVQQHLGLLELSCLDSAQPPARPGCHLTKVPRNYS